MNSVPLIGFRNADLAFADHLVLGKLSFESGAARLSASSVRPAAARRRLRVAAGLLANVLLSPIEAWALRRPGPQTG